VRAPAFAEAVTRLPGLCPCADVLAALGRSPASAWAHVRLDPGGVLLLVRHGEPSPTLPGLSFFPSSLREPAVLEEAVRQLDAGTGFVDWNQPAAGKVYRAALTFAHLAEHLATRSGLADPDNAWAAGLLAPLGWLAVCAVEPEQAAACMADPRWPLDPAAVQRRLWGLDQGGIARRLNRRWRLPRWLAAVTGHLELPAPTAQMLGAEADLFRVVQLAVGLAQRQQGGLRLGLGETPEQNAAALNVAPGDVEEVERLAANPPAPPSPWVWKSPAAEPLLRDLLVLAAENRCLADAPVVANLETDLDQLHRALLAQQASEEGRLRALKLSALAEFAAGAGHEINNPLAVISGQAQYLLGHETEPARQRALQTIVNQAQRIHLILSALMQFARPARPRKQLVDLPALMREVAASLTDLAAQRRVQLTCSPPDHPLSFLADPRQVSIALACLLQNAIEAAPADGWAQMRLETPAPDRVELVIEDNGTGLSVKQREHLFDPFYSGRPAGRGRGLGLSTAWRLAREHGGEVRFEDLPQGPTRFVLSLPREGTGHRPEANGHHPPAPTAA
jgi:two-component system, NtrC family, sensor kinase